MLRRGVVAVVVLAVASLPALAADKDIVDTAVAAGNFKTLVEAVQTAGLVETLKGPGPFTVFAPTDEAFAKLGQKTIQDLLKDKKKLGDILKYHVVSGEVMAEQAAKINGPVKTVLGKEVMVQTGNGQVMVGNAKVIKTDIKCKNGVIHVIDTVILPPSN
jgi:uncharacterized surface protein with fasciclin (FAS1) repeats